jgi:hypothetical protein
VGIITGSPDVFGSDRDAADDQRDMIQKVREVPAEKLLPQVGRVAAILKQARSMTQQAIDEVTALVENTRRMIEDRGH